MTAFVDPVEYTVEIAHYHSGEVVVVVREVGHSIKDRKAVAYALREVIRQLEDPAVVAVDKKAFQ